MKRTTQDKHIWMLQTCSATVYKAHTQEWALEQDADYDCTLYLGDDHILYNHKV